MKKADSSLPIERICRLCGVPIANYYYKPTDNLETEKNIQLKMNDIHTDNLKTYGRRRMKTALIDEGIQLGEFKIARLMKDAGIVAKTPQKPHNYPKGVEKPNIPNLLNRQFNPDKANTHWVGDITYIRNHQGWSYLATVLDLGTREISAMRYLKALTLSWRNKP